MITVIYTDDDRILITDKHTKKDLKAVIKEAREDMVEMASDEELLAEADNTRRSYILISHGDLRVDKACRP
jgi:hypothetical protein